MEYLKQSCQENAVCDSCTQAEWIGPQMDGVPRPFPDKDKSGYYRNVFDTPSNNQPVDDYRPRANLKALFEAMGRCSMRQNCHNF